MLAVKNHHRVVKGEDGANAPLPAALSLVMDDDNGGIIKNLPTRLPDAECPVQILPVHEEALVQQAGTFDSLPAHQHGRADDAIDLGQGVLVEKGEVIAREFAAPWKEAVQPEGVIKGDARIRKAAPAGQVQSTVAHDQLRP